MRVSVDDPRRCIREVLHALDRNEPVTLLHRGKVKGVLHPPTPPSKATPVSEHPAFGLWKDRTGMKNVRRVVRNIRKGRLGAD